MLRYNPGIILAIGVAMGMGLGLPSTFLRTYATELGIPRIGLFFLVYSIAAIAIRVPTRRWTERFGPRRIILVGMAHHDGQHRGLSLGPCGMAIGPAGDRFRLLARHPLAGGGRGGQRHVSASSSRTGHRSDLGGLGLWGSWWPPPPSG